MTMRLDLRVHPSPTGLSGWRLSMSPTPYGCADCGRWFQFAWQLVQHVCEARDE